MQDIYPGDKYKAVLASEFGPKMTRGCGARGGGWRGGMWNSAARPLGPLVCMRGPGAWDGNAWGRGVVGY
jgi:hypothetical protein